MENENNLCQKRLKNAEKLIVLTKNEAERWKVTVGVLSEKIEQLFGDVFLGVASISYNGPFTGLFRQQLTEQWRARIAELAIPSGENPNIVQTLGDALKMREWMM